MHSSFIIYHVERVEKGLVKTLPNAETGDLVFITGSAEGDTGTLGVLLECLDPYEPLWTTQPLPTKELPSVLMSRLNQRLSGEDAPKMFQPILDAQQET